MSPSGNARDWPIVKSHNMAERKALRKRALPALLVAGFALLAMGMVAIHQQGRQSELLLTQSRRAWCD